jgi:hypothetical protein
MSDLEARIINDLVMFGDDDKPKEPVKPERITPKDLMPEAYPIKRGTKRRPRRNVPRGSNFSPNYVRSVYQSPETLQAQHDATPKPHWTPGSGEDNLWSGTDNRGHTNGHRVV